MGFPPPLGAHIISQISCLLLSIKLHPIVSKTISFGLSLFALVLNLLFLILIFCLCSQFPSSFFYISILLFSCFYACILTILFLPSLFCFLYFLSFLEKRRLKSDLITLCSQVKTDITRKNSLKLHMRRYRLDIGGKFLH